jgi:predicted signal transduction protein with EAL and GGDEF domain
MIIKMDRSFVSPLKASIYNDTLLEAIISLGHKLNMTVLAEGIETQAQLERPRHLHREVGQGYLFSRTVPAGEVTAMLGRVLGNWGQRLALSPPADPPAAKSGTDTPRSSDTAYCDLLNSPEAVHQPERRGRWRQI